MAGAPAIEFRTGIRDKLGYAARWLAVAVRKGARVRVLADAEDLQRLSQSLWTADKESFIAHRLCLPEPSQPSTGGDMAKAWARTPVWLGSGAVDAPEPELLINLGMEIPANVSAYARVIEVVASAEADVLAGRRRWAGYLRRGLEPQHREPGGESDRGGGVSFSGENEDG